MHKAAVWPRLRWNGREPGIANRETTGDIVDDIRLVRAVGLHDLAGGRRPGRCSSIILKKAAHVGFVSSAYRRFAKYLVRDVSEFLLGVRSWDLVGVWTTRPRRTRSACKNFRGASCTGQVEKRVCGEAVKGCRILCRNVEFRRVGFVVVKPTQKVVKRAVLKHDHYDMLNDFH